MPAPFALQVKAGVDAWSNGDYATAVKAWQAPAAAGDADAMFNLAQAYKLGRGVPQDLAKAEALYDQNWRDRLTARYGSPPNVSYFDSQVTVDPSSIIVG